jgi:hypothetical protein
LFIPFLSAHSAFILLISRKNPARRENWREIFGAVTVFHAKNPARREICGIFRAEFRTGLNN